MSVIVENIVKRFNGTAALAGADLTVADGELVALLGPSGSGKTTLLRVIAGLEQPDEGSLRIDGHDALALPTRERGIGFVFQHYALFRAMSVFENIAFGLRVRPRASRPSRQAISQRVEELLGLVQLEGLGGRYPSQLSGGQRQRVALARALAVEPRLLLLDEPFGALDAKVRVELRHWLRDLHDRLGITTLFVTHDQEEALELADRVAILNSGRIEQVAAPREVYDRPATAFVMDFLGEVNRLACTVEQGKVKFDGRVVEDVEATAMPDGPGLAFVRPHEVVLAPSGGNGFTATIRSLSVIGPRTRIHLDYKGALIEADVARSLTDRFELTAGAEVGFTFRAVRVYPAS